MSFEYRPSVVMLSYDRRRELEGASADAIGERNPIGPPSAGAVIYGRIEGVNRYRSSPESPRRRPTVRVVGTDISTTVDSDGHFTLNRVPEGMVRLEIGDFGPDATVAVPGVELYDQIRIVVRIMSRSAEDDR